MTITPIAPSALMPTAGGMPQIDAAGTGDSSFIQVINRMLKDTNALQGQADQAVQNLALGHEEQFHNVMLSVAKADLNFHMILEVRNRLTDAYQEVMHMQF